MSKAMPLLAEHNSACERAQLSACNCFCHGAGHQLDLLKRAVSCTSSGVNNISQLLLDLESVFGGFHKSFRDATTPSRRKVPEDLPQLNLDRRRGATWAETLLLDEALHAAFIKVALSSIPLSDVERKERIVFVEELAEDALELVGRDVDAHNITDGHLWCSVLAELNSPQPASFSAISGTSRYGKVCYPRNRTFTIPGDLASVRTGDFTPIQTTLTRSLPDKDAIVRLMGAASCPDLWHHPAAVRYSLRPFLIESSWPPASTSTLANLAGLDVIASRWRKRGNW